MQKSLISCLALTAALFFASSCTNPKNPSEDSADVKTETVKPQTDEEAIYACVEKLIKTAYEEDFNVVWAICVPSLSQDVKEQFENMIKNDQNCFLSVTFDSCNVITKEDDRAIAEVSVIVKDMDEEPRPASRRFDLQRIDGQWYIVDPRGFEK